MFKVEVLKCSSGNIILVVPRGSPLRLRPDGNDCRICASVCCVCWQLTLTPPSFTRLHCSGDRERPPQSSVFRATDTRATTISPQQDSRREASTDSSKHNYSFVLSQSDGDSSLCCLTVQMSNSVTCYTMYFTIVSGRATLGNQSVRMFQHHAPETFNKSNEKFTDTLMALVQ